MHIKFADNNGVKIEYIRLNDKAGDIPLVIIPGAIVGALDIYEEIKVHTDLNIIIISIRGRGESAKPVTGFLVEEQASDIACVVDAENLTEIYLLGHSNGAGIAAAYAAAYPGKVKGLICADYPPVYPKYSKEWAEYAKANHPDIDDNLLKGLVNDSVRKNFSEDLAELNIPVLLLKAENESLLKPEAAEDLCKKYPAFQLKIIHDCTHEMFADKPIEVFKEAIEFMK